ncbi:MAG: sulfatase, partial [Phycisphaerae bacterium]
MDRRRFLELCGWGAAAMVVGRLRSAANEPPGRRNVIMILADDMGWMDSSVYGSGYYESPNLQRLARRGMLFTDAYAANPLCSPTRASIMTGKYPARLKITTPAGHLPPQPDTPLLGKTAQPWLKMVCPRSRRFLPLEERTLAEAFKEAGYATGFIGKWHLGHEPWWPKKQGFDVNIAGGHYPGPPSYFSPYRIKTLVDGPKGEYLTDRLTDEALKYIEDRRHGPLLLCLWHYAVHAPFQAKEKLVEDCRSRTDPRGKQGCAIMAAMLKSLDESVGRVLDRLDGLKIADETIIVFASDNGGNMYNVVEGRPPTNNHPLRNGKGSIYEGGTRTPCIVVWPGTVEPHSRCSEVISSIDFFPTMLEMAGIQPRQGLRFDGESIVPLLKGTGKLRREAVFCHFPHYIPATGNLPGTSVRQGDWKLIRLYGEGPGRSCAYELYNLKDDIGETINLAEKFPEKVKQLDGLISRHLEETGALVPIPNPAY